MDRVVVDRTLDSLRRCLLRVRSKCPANAATLAADVDLQDFLVLNLSRAVQICVDLAAHLLVSRELPPPDTMGQACERLEEAEVLDAELALRMRKAVGIRTIAVHAYDAIDWDLVFAIASTPALTWRTSRISRRRLLSRKRARVGQHHAARDSRYAVGFAALPALACFISAPVSLRYLLTNARDVGHTDCVLTRHCIDKGEGSRPGTDTRAGGSATEIASLHVGRAPMLPVEKRPCGQR